MIRHPERIEIDKCAPRTGRRPWLLVYAVLACIASALWLAFGWK